MVKSCEIWHTEDSLNINHSEFGVFNSIPPALPTVQKVALTFMPYDVTLWCNFPSGKTFRYFSEKNCFFKKHGIHGD